MQTLFRDVVNDIIDQCGTDILLDGNRFFELTEQMAPDMFLERRVVRRLWQEELLPEVYRAVTAYSGSDEELNSLDISLDDAGFSEKWKQIVFDAFGLQKAKHIYPDLDELIKQAVDRIAPDATIVVENSLSGETALDLVNGMRIDRGFLSPYMIRDTEKMETVMEDPYILITNGTILEREAIFPILDMAAQSQKELLIIVSEIETDVLSAVIEQLDRVPCAVIKAPGYGERRVGILQDIAALTGGLAITDKGELDPRYLSPDMFGRASQVRVKTDDTVIVDGKGSNEQIQNQIEAIRYTMEITKSDFDREKLQERMENLRRGVVILQVGGRTVQELEDRVRYAEAAVEKISH